MVLSLQTPRKPGLETVRAFSCHRIPLPLTLNRCKETRARCIQHLTRKQSAHLNHAQTYKDKGTSQSHWQEGILHHHDLRPIRTRRSNRRLPPRNRRVPGTIRKPFTGENQRLPSPAPKLMTPHIKGGSWKPLPHSIARDKAISPNAFRVWAVIRSHEDKHGHAQLSNETIAEESAMNRRTVQRAKKELTERKLLKILFQPKGRNQGSCTYKTIQGCHKVPTKEKELTKSDLLKFEVTPSWEKRMHAKHDCYGCGWCHQCRDYEYQQSQPPTPH